LKLWFVRYSDESKSCIVSMGSYPDFLTGRFGCQITEKYFLSWLKFFQIHFTICQ